MTPETTKASPASAKSATPRHLKTYAAAAATAAIGGGAADVYAEIIFTDLQPDIVLDAMAPMGSSSIIFETIDLDNNGVVDFQVLEFQNNAGPMANGNVIDIQRLYAEPDNAFIGFTNYGYEYVAPLTTGFPIGFGTGFFTGVGGTINFSTNDVPYGSYIVGTFLVGVGFQINGNAHFGWIQFESDPTDGGSLSILSWAYEDVPGASIQAGAIPEPSTLGLLALGAAGVLGHRRRRQAQADAA